MAVISVGDVLYTSRMVPHRVIRVFAASPSYYSDNRPHVKITVVSRSGRKETRSLSDWRWYLNYGKWSHVHFPRIIRLPVGI